MDGPQMSSMDDRVKTEKPQKNRCLNTAWVNKTERAGELDRVVISIRLAAEVNFAYDYD